MNMTNTRIPLTDEDIKLNDNEGYDGVWIGFDYHKPHTSSEETQWSEQLKKQILDDHEYREYYNESYLGSIKEKAEKWDVLQDDLKNWKSNDRRQKLEQENKQLKEKAEKYDGLVKEYGEFLKRNEKNKEKAEKWDKFDSDRAKAIIIAQAKDRVELEQENKRLKEKILFTINEDGTIKTERLDAESIKNKEIVQKVKERMKSTKAINPLWYDIKEILGDKE